MMLSSSQTNRDRCWKGSKLIGGTEVTVELKEEARRIVTAHDPHAADDTASALQRLWSQVPATEGGARLVKAEARAELSGHRGARPGLERDRQGDREGRSQESG